MDTKKLADLLFPNITKSVEYYINKYPARNLPDGAFVTRFAPSPTGYMHIGGIYQCTLAKFLASSTGGVFYLRIEDTDKKREVKDAKDIVYPAMCAFGVKPDDGYVSSTEQVGEYGSYLQSDRTEIYQTFAKELVARGLAYPCFCDDDGEDETSSAREEQKRLGLPTGYYGRWAKCRNLTLEQVEENLKNGKPFKIRIKSSGDGKKRMVFCDELRGQISFLENYVDYVILKSDGTALYHLAHLVDDTLMHTTLVTRDESWLPSAPLHIQLFEYMGLKPPKYLHTAQIMTIGEDGNKRKISKRYDNWADSRWFIEQGYSKNAIEEYLLNLLNSNYEIWRTQNPDVPYTDFKISIDKMSKSGALFDMVKFNDISKTVVSKMSSSEVYDLAYVWAKDYDQELYELMTKHKQTWLDIFSIERNAKKPSKAIAKWSDIKHQYYFFFDELFAPTKEKYEFDERYKDDKQLLYEVMDKYMSNFDGSDDKDTWFNKIKCLAGELGFATDMKEYKNNPDLFKGNYGDVASIIRMVLTSEKNTPDLYAICQIVGKQRLMQRIEKFKEIY